MLRVLLVAAGLWLASAAASVADPLADVRAGNQAFAEGRLEQAVSDFGRAIDSGGLDAEGLALALNNRGVVLAELGDFDRAIADYTRALELKPGDAKTIRNLRIAHTRRGLAAARLGEPERALVDLGRAIELEPSHPTAYLRRGELRLERGELQAAIEDLEAAARLAPDNREARAELDRARAALAAHAAPAPEPAVAPSARPPAPAPAAPAPTAPGPTAATPAAATAATPPSSGPAAAPPASTPPPGPVAATSPGEAAGPRFRVTTDVFVRAEPLTSSTAIGSLRRGSQFVARAEDKGWFKVELADGRSGWIYRRFVEPVEPAAQ